MPDSLSDRDFQPDPPPISKLDQLFPGFFGDNAELESALNQLAQQPDQDQPDFAIFAQKAAEIGAVQIAAARAGFRAWLGMAFGFWNPTK